MNTSITKKSALYKAIALFAAIAASVILPQIFHAIGAISGTGAKVASAFLPMHIPVILAGFIGGPAIGVIAGILSPLTSFAISGLPTAALLPFMVIELGVYGLVSGLISGAKFNSFTQLIIVQLAGRTARALAIIASIFILGNASLTIASIGEFIIAGLFGIVLQWAFIPLAVDKIRGRSDV